MKSPVTKNGMETAKTVTIFVLITAIVMFVAGMRYADAQNAKVTEAVKAVQIEAPKEVSKQ